MRKMKIKKIISVISLIYILTTIIILRFNPFIFFATNDDGIFVSILENNLNFIGQNNLIYPSIIYGYFTKILYNLFPLLQWHGFILLILVLVSFIRLTYEILKLQINKFYIFIPVLMLYIQFIYFVFTPNFSSAALYMGLIACILFYISILFKYKIYKTVIFYFLFSYLIRPDGFIFILYIAFPGFIYLLIQNIRNKSFKNSINFRWSLLLIAYIIDEAYQKYLIITSSVWNEYYKFINIFHEVDTNPSFLIMHQNIAAFKIPGLKWTNVEATLLHQIAYLDPNIFNSKNLSLAVDSVYDHLGIRGMINANFLGTLLRIWEYMTSVEYLFYASIIILSILIIKLKNFRINLLFSLLYIFIIFYFLGAVWRLPIRILLPIVFIIFIFLLVISIIYVLENKWKNIILLTSITLFALFHLNQYGLKGQIQKSNIKYQEYKILTNKYKSLGNSSIFIGQIKYLDENFTNAYIRGQDLNTVHISSGWHNFSPYWYSNIKQLGIKTNPLLSLAELQNVYWVSDKYISEVLDMYMNDRNIERQKICEIIKFGVNSGSIYSFSTKDIPCLN